MHVWQSNACGKLLEVNYIDGYRSFGHGSGLAARANNEDFRKLQTFFQHHIDLPFSSRLDFLPFVADEAEDNHRIGGAVRKRILSILVRRCSAWRPFFKDVYSY